MNTFPPAPGCPVWSRFARLLPVVVAVGLVAFAIAAEPVPAGPAEPKTHTLFMGADILVEQNQVMHRVQDVVGGSFLIKVDGKEVKIPADWGNIKMKVDRALKLTGTSVAVDRLKVERAYTPGNDPVKKFMAAQGASVNRESEGDAYAKLMIAQQGGNLAFGTQAQIAGSPVNGGPSAAPNAMVAGAERNSNSVAGAARLNSSNFVGMTGTMQDELAAEQFDALDISFDVSSEKLLRKPYVIVMTQYHERDSKPGEVRNWLYAAALEPLGEKPQKVRVNRGGFPPGYVLEKYQVHIYDGGQEMGSNVADTQVQLTRTEAFTYLLLDYMGSHKGATLPAAPVMGKLTAEARARLSPDQWRQAYFVKVSPDGFPVGAFADAACSHPVGEMIAAMVADIRFYPALAKGKAVDGVAELRFPRLDL